jgi:SAM-dependent methyltransferase
MNLQACRICGNSENNRIHKAREMMFGTGETFDYLECTLCGTIQIAEIPKDLSRHYPKEYYSFDERAEAVEFAPKFKRRLAARMAARYFVHGRNFVGKYLAEKKAWIRDYYPASLRQFPLGINFKSKILDFGCGNGRLLQILYHFGFRSLTGADAFIESDIFYPNGVKIYKRTLSELQPSFDLIMLHHSFEHLPNPLETLLEICRLLADKKLCLVRLPVVNFAWEKYGTNWVQLDAPRHLFLYTERSFRMLAEKAGFAVERVIYDSEAFQFWGSEQYERGIALTSERGYKGDVSKSVFTAEQFDEWQSQAEQLNGQGKGDQACFYLRKAAGSAAANHI